MFGIGKKKKVTTIDFDEKVKAAKYDRIFQSLKDIVKTEVTTKDKDGKDIIDYVATVSAIKTKARMTIEFIADLEKGSGDDEK